MLKLAHLELMNHERSNLQAHHDAGSLIVLLEPYEPFLSNIIGEGSVPVNFTRDFWH